jgi:glycosyl transferase family 87
LEELAPEIRSWWFRRRRTMLRAAVVLLAIEAVVFLAYESWRLVLDHGHTGARDRALRVAETQSWFDGLAVYERFHTAVYPPATYAILWPFVGWLRFDFARWLWAATTLVSLVWLAILLVRESGVRGRGGSSVHLSY